MKARKKAGVIEVQQFKDGEVQSWPPFVKFGARGVVDPTATKVWNGVQKTWVGVNDGDYIRIDNPDEVYPIAAYYFAQNYDVVQEA